MNMRAAPERAAREIEDDTGIDWRGFSESRTLPGSLGHDDSNHPSGSVGQAAANARPSGRSPVGVSSSVHYRPHAFFSAQV
jgi:hypothetical protein